MRINSIPESEGEDTDAIVQQIASSIDVSLPPDAIDRSHRVGRRGVATQSKDRDRAIIVKFTSYKHKDALMKARKNLRKVDGKTLFKNVTWPSLPGSSTNSDNRGQTTAHRIFINDDLTKTRAEIAGKARELKRTNKIEDTWVRDGFIFIKDAGKIDKITTKRELAVFSR